MSVPDRTAGQSERVVVTRGEAQALRYYERYLRAIARATRADADSLRNTAEQTVREGRRKQGLGPIRA